VTDWVGWLGAGTGIAAFVVSAGAGTAAWRSLSLEKEATESARRSAEAAERANLLTERALARGVPTVESDPSAVAWSLTKSQRGNSRWVLRNIGTATAEHVRVDEPDGPISRNFPTDAVLRPNQAVDLIMHATWGGGVPNELYVRWDEDEEAILPVDS
jgi:hypothetical protein